MLCKYCDEMTIEALSELAEIQASKHDTHSYDFAQDAYYRHQPSYGSLIDSAQNGCELCGFIYEGFKAYATNMKPKIDQSAYILDIEGEISRKRDQGLPTDIRICIDSSYCFTHQDPKELYLFDVLSVRVGDEVGVDLEDKDGLLLPLRFRLSVPQGLPNVLGKYQVGRYITDPNLGSVENFHLARSWLKQCCDDHPSCPDLQETDLPTRVIDVGNNCKDHVRLVLSNGRQGSYIALSHCWGGEVPLQLVGSNLDRFVRGIPLDDLPANFQDAVLITRQLGLQYIWIDSLCIIQDSLSDWENEAKRMGDIYQRASLVIAAAASKNPSEGILNTYIPKFKESGLRLKSRTNRRPEDCVRIFQKDEEEETLWSLLEKGSWVSRGWTFQERILACRVLYYGRRQIYWQCQGGYRCADNIPEGNDTPQLIDYPLLATYLIQNPNFKSNPDMFPIGQIYDEWYELVREYSGKSLTFNTDKFMALAGLTAKFAELTADEYVAGLWLRDFRQGLLWISDLGTATPVQQYLAPSWSWASTNDPIIFPNRERTSSEYNVTLLDHHIELKKRNPFAQVEGGYLLLDGYTLPLLRTKQFIQQNTEILGELGYDTADFDQPTRYGTRLEPVERLFPTNEYNDGPAAISVLVSWSYSDAPLKSEIDQSLIYSDECLILLISFSASTAEHDAMASALVVSPTNHGTETYKRVGTADFRPSKTDDESWLKDWGWVRRTLKIV